MKNGIDTSMKTVLKKLILSAALAASICLARCAPPEVAEGNYLIFRRLPKDVRMVAAINLREILESKFISSKLAKASERVSFSWREREIRLKLGIDLFSDIERLAVFTRDSKGSFEDNWAAVVQGRLEGFFLDSILVNGDILDSLCRMEDFKVHCITIADDKENQKLFLFFDKEEILLTPSQMNMVCLLKLKKGGGESLSGNRELVKKILSLKYHNQIWFTIPTERIMKDVLEKVRREKPDFRKELLGITSIQGGLDLDSELGLALQAYCLGGEQAKLIFDTLNGLLAVGKLTTVAMPKARKYLDRIEVGKKDNLIEINFSIPLEDIELTGERITPKQPSPLPGNDKKTGREPAASGAQLEEEFLREIPFEPGGSLSLKNVLGDIEISGWDKNLMQIQAVKTIKSRIGGGWGVSQRWLDTLKIEIDKKGNRVGITTVTPTNKTYSDYLDDLLFLRPAMEVDYVVRLPRRTDLTLFNFLGKPLVEDLDGQVKAENFIGEIEMKGVSGHIEANNGRGGIEINLEGVKLDRGMELSARDGSITLKLPSGAAADLDLSAIHGRIDLDLPEAVEGETNNNRVRGKLAGGGPLIKINTDHGDVRIKK